MYSGIVFCKEFIMKIEDFIAGKWQKGYEYRYFMPEKINQAYNWENEAINTLLEDASRKLGELNSFSRFVPDTNIFILMHITKEAVLSSKIEGTMTNIEEAFQNEQDINPEKRNDWREVNNYIKAMNFAIDELKRMPLSNRLLKSIHEILLESVRGEHKSPGEFRNSQNWIGGATLKDAVFIPPVATGVAELMSDMEKFLHNDEIHLPHLIRIAIAHYQFETIHPFLDGNGRIGRLLIPLYLVSTELLGEPLLYISAFFENNKYDYYDNLMQVRLKNNLVQWVKFFLVAVSETSEKAIVTLKKIVDLKHSLEEKKISLLGRRRIAGKKVLDSLFSSPVLYIKNVEDITGLSTKAAYNLAAWFEEQKILKEITGYKRNRMFVFDEYVKLF